MKNKFVDFWESRILDSDFITGVIFGAIFSILMSVLVQNNLLSWSVGTIFMTVILSLTILIFAPIVNLGFLVGFYFLTFCMNPKENVEFLVIFLVFLFVNFFSYKHKKVIRDV